MNKISLFLLFFLAFNQFACSAQEKESKEKQEKIIAKGFQVFITWIEQFNTQKEKSENIVKILTILANCVAYRKDAITFITQHPFLIEIIEQYTGYEIPAKRNYQNETAYKERCLEVISAYLLAVKQIYAEIYQWAKDNSFF